MRLDRVFGASLVLLSVASCTWVTPTSSSQSIVLLEQHQVVNCAKKGVTSVKTLNKIAFIPRSREKVFAELVALAKNEAAVLGGDTVVAEAVGADGGQSFGVYRCRSE